MSYERLNIQDHVDKWDVEKVKHLEDGIIANEEAIANLNVSSGGAQSDWGQNDENAADYVKNRTHFKVLTEHKILDNFEVYKKVDEEYGESWLTPTSQECDINIADIDIDTPASITINGVEKSVLGTVRLDPQGVPREYEWIYDEDYVIRYSYNNIYIDGPKHKMEANDKFIVSMTIAIANYTPLNDKYIPDSVIRKGELTQSDWNCNDSQNVDYIKNRTHYDYYEADYGTGRCEFPYVFTVNRNNTSDDHWLGDEAFFLLNHLLNSESDWEYIDEQYDGETGITITHYQWRHEGNKDNINDCDVTINAEVIDDYPEYQVTFTSDREYLSLYKAILKTKTLDPKFLPETNVIKDWSVNDEVNSAYIQNRTHYAYEGCEDYIIYYNEHEEEYTNKLPYTETIQSYLSQSDAPGYWLGDARYLLNNHVVDAYSNWTLKSYSDNDLPIYELVIHVNEYSSYEIQVEVSYQGYGRDSQITWLNIEGYIDRFGRAVTLYKELDINYIPKLDMDHIPKLDMDHMPTEVAHKPNWQESDQYSPSYIFNKPFYEQPEKRIAILDNTITQNPQYLYDTYLPGGTYIITIDDEISEKVTASWESGESDTNYLYLETAQLLIKGRGYEDRYSVQFEIKKNLTTPYKVKVEYIDQEYELKQLDDKFVPDNIMRKTDLLSWDNIVDKPFYDTMPNGLISSFIDTTYYSKGEHLETGKLVLENRYIEAWQETASWDEGVHPKVTQASDGVEILYLGNLSLCSKIANGENTSENYVIWWSKNYGEDTLHIVNNYLFKDEYFDCCWLEITPPTLKTIEDKYIPSTIARAPGAILDYVTDTPTAEQYNALLDVLKQTGILI